ncbi:MAG: endonuclease/exonuclease/phosphatase family protein [Planctomycetota bacterium]|nr:MAG: endonuclease/exonuclease/phosphatase family protein [Planctomycetota bacterium]
MRLRVLTYNVLACKRLERTFDLLNRLDADIICLQEVLVAAKGRRPSDQAKWLADALGFQYVSEGRYRYVYGLAGNVILTHYRLESTRVLTGPQGKGFGLGAIIECAGLRIAVVCGHYAFVPRPLPIGVAVSSFLRTAQVRRTLQWIRQTGLPAIVAGDLNCLPYMLEYRTIAKQMADCSRAVPVNHRNTRPTWGLPAQIDYIFTSSHFRTLSCSTVNDEDNISDHRPVLADIELILTESGHFM